MNLIQPFYIEPRNGSIDLCGEWEYGYTDAPVGDTGEIEWKYTTRIPSSVYYSLYHSNVLKHPYVDLNSKDYHWVDEKVWYYRKTFIVTENEIAGKDAFLCFDGVAYYSKVWMNGIFLGEHEGMFGGPFANICDMLKTGENVLVVEVRACTYGKKDRWKARNNYGENREIVPWDLARNVVTNNQDFIVLGIWNRVRLEMLPKIHINRPYLQIQSISGGKARLRLNVELATGEIDELKMQLNIKYDGHEMNYVKGLLDVRKDEKVKLEISICEKKSGKEVVKKCEDVALLDYSASPQEPLYHQCQFYSTEIEIENPSLWYPNGLGEAFLYVVNIKLYKKDEKTDEISFDYGIKTFELGDTEGGRFRNAWGKYRFLINGKPFFLKGMNFLPMDMLLKIDDEDYRWTLELAKAQGIQLIRVWSGGGIPELDIFYKLCDELGIMVWQDHPIANQQTPNWPQEVLEAQVAMNVFRIRNHPSLAMYCGGNEFNPYAPGNAASMFVIRRTLEDLDPARPFVRTTPDRGSAHVYTDFEPNWFRLLYKSLPFLAESGIHSMPNMSTFRQVISNLPQFTPDLTNEAWCKDYPEFMSHFIEYSQERVDRICARASHINKIENSLFEEFVEAVQFSCCDFYKLMAESMRENYPVTGGIMPWAFKRPWPNMCAMMVDGLGKPVPAYYYVKNSYISQTPILCLEHMMYAPDEEIPMKIALINDEKDGIEGEIRITVYHPDLGSAYSKSQHVQTNDGEYKRYFEFDAFKLTNEFADKFILIKTELIKDGKCKARNVYWPKCLKMLENKELWTLYKGSPQKNLYFEKGPHLKPQLAGTKARLTCSEAVVERKARRTSVTVKVKNASDIPAFPVFFDAKSNAPFYVSDNYFLLDGGEERRLEIVLRIPDDTELPQMTVVSWNAEETAILQKGDESDACV